MDDACIECKQSLDIHNYCENSGEECVFCKKCCVGHCITCGGGDSFHRNADGEIYACFYCRKKTHCGFGYCEEGGILCKDCGNPTCGECKDNLLCKNCVEKKHYNE
jgi:hypothetical protein